jgi:hypothetical protein
MALFLAKLIETHDVDNVYSRRITLPSGPNRQREMEESIRIAREKMESIFPEVVLKRASYCEATVGSGSEELVSVLRSVESDSIDDAIAELRRKKQELEEQERERVETEKDLRGSIILELHAFFSNLINAKISQQPLDEIRTELRLSVSPTIAVGKFLENIVSGINLTDQLRNVTVESVIADPNATLASLSEIFSVIQSLPAGSIARTVVKNRFNLVIARITKEMEKRMKDTSSMRSIYTFMSHFKNEKISAEQLILSPAIAKFEYLFVRPDSALNTVEHPEWPLRRLLEICSETVQLVNAQNPQEIAVFVANYARRYFTMHRWSLVDIETDEGNDLFALYMSAYLGSAHQWKSQYGDSACLAFLGDVIDNTVVNEQWSLLDAWIEYDRTYMEHVLENVSDPFSPSIHNTNVCNLVQVLLDLLDTSNSRLEVLRVDMETFEYFVEHCHDNVVRNQLMHKARIHVNGHISSDSPNKNLLVKQSLDEVERYVSTTKLASESIRKHIRAFINDMDS